MHSLSGPAREDLLRKVSLLCVLRLQGYTEDEIVERLEFGSVEAMHKQLDLWGVPGLVPAFEGNHNPEGARRERQARCGGGEAKELPPAANAEDEFFAAINSLALAVPSTRTKEFLQDERFIELVRSSRGIKWREDYDSKDWEAICVQLGQDPATTDYTVEFGPHVPVWGSPYPAKQLRNLIAVCLLAADTFALSPEGGDSPVWKIAERLLEKLHPEPSTVDREKLREVITSKKDGLIRKADQAALLIRGGTLRQGPKPAELSNSDLEIISTIQRLRKPGVPEREIVERLREEVEYYYSKEDFARLGKLGVSTLEEAVEDEG